jgi:CheY-like chemotaxis protein
VKDASGSEAMAAGSSRAADPGLTGHDPAGIVVRQLAAVQAWLRLRATDEQALAATSGDSREHAMTVRRRAHALQVEAQAVREHCWNGTHAPRPPRAVLVHRQPWLLNRLVAGLTALGVHVVAAVDDGAEGSGIAVAEAPELVFLEAALATMSGVEVTCRVRECSPTTLVAAQVPYSEDRPALLAAGAAAVWLRQVPPADVLDGLAALLRRLAEAGRA